MSWYPSQYYNADNEPANDPRISQTVTTLVDTNQVSKTTYSYDQFNNQTDSYEYDYGTGAAGALVRHIHTDYVTTNPVNGTDYTATGVYLRSLPSQTSVFDAGGVERSRTTLEYDNYAADSNHSPLTDRVNISGHDSGFTTAYATRGNLTAITHYLLTNGAVTGSVRAYSQFDIAGNLTKTIDARGYATTIDYADRFGAPDGEARSNTPPSELTGLSSFAFATKLTNALGQTVYGQYDYYLGRPVDGEDLNGIVASAYYNDALDRPTQVRRAVTTPAASQSTFSYDDPNHTITVTSDLNTNNDNALVTKTLYDGLGRTTESRQYEGGTNYIAVQTQYDGLGRAYKTSNPFRPWQSETAQWTTSGFDGMGRVVSLTTPDNGVVATSYSGNSVTVTDQAGKARKSVTDALGRLSQVYEDPSGLNYQTTYAYDVLDNLTTVTQGTQTRSFVYDSLKRLTSATNPESGTITYQYDNNSNLIQKTDARSIVSTYAYDALSRNTTIDYSDTSSINPDVTRVYDGAMNGKGRLWVSYAGGDLSNGSNVEQVAIDNYDALGRPTVQRQLFKVNGTWGTTYQISSVYNLAGAVTSQTYPSGHTVSYSNDSAGRTNSFSGNLGDATTRTYATGITYDPSGGVRQEQFGTQIPLYHKKHYNRRGQLFDIRVSTVSWDTDQWNWNRGALVNYYSSNYAWEGDPSTPAGPDNNGNVLLQQHWVPTDDAISSFYHTQDFYTYDSLNRIQSAAEFHASLAGQSAQDFAQMFAYDRWGNRTINPASWGVGINTKQFTVDANTNRLGVPAGQSGVMSYDVAGNLSTDSYTGFGSRVYNAENKMTAAQDNSGVWAYYTYNADGQRTRRKINNQETWQVYGFSGELLAEYSANAPAASPQKEYGYRSGQLLVTLDAPPANGYAYRRAITIDHTKIPNTDQTDFPVLISGTYSYLATTANGGNVQNANGYDVIFTSDTGCATKLNHEVETYTAANGAVNYWVKLPAVSHTTDTVIYMCYGNSLITTDQSNRTGVWDANYKGVWHLNDNAASTAVTDSTGANNGTNQANTSGKTASGKVGKALTYNGSSDYTDMGTNVGGYVLSDSFTVEAWVNAALDSANRAVYGNAYALAGYLLRVNTANKVRFVVVTNGSNFNGRDSSTLSSGWHHVVAVYGGSGTPSVYIDGVLDNAATVSGGTVTTITTAAHTRIGAAPESGYESYFNGTIDEVRTSKIARSADWIKTEYNNQNSPSTFYSVSSATSLTLPSQVSWLVTDQLGTPRMIIDQTGSLANVKRHDYLPFGEELFAPTGGRTATLGYSGSDNLHQQFTSKERDNETGLDYFGTRYHSSIQGRFTSVDPANYQARLNPTDPQSWNAYSYVNNHPLVLVDRDGKGIGSFFEKLKNLFLWNMWATNEDVQKEEDKQRQYLLQHADAYGGVIIMSPVTGLYMRVYPREMNRANVFLWSDAAHYWEENGGGYRQLTPQEMASVIDAGGTLYRGGSNITVREKIDVNIKDGMVQTNKGPSLNMDPEKIKQFGGAYRVESMPDELQVIQRGQDPGHYEIVPKSPMPLERFIELLQKVVLKPE